MFDRYVLAVAENAHQHQYPTFDLYLFLWGRLNACTTVRSGSSYMCIRAFAFLLILINILLGKVKLRNSYTSVY